MSENRVNADERAGFPGRFSLLLLSLLLMLVLYPLFEGYSGQVIILRVLFSAILLSAVHALSDKKATFIIALVLVIPGLLGSWGAHLLAGSAIFWPGVLFQFLFLVFVLVVVLAHILRETRVDLDIILGSACGYLLLGLIWAMIYFFVEAMFPGSFSRGSSPAELTSASGLRLLSLPPFVYYSYITLTTLGYGDITPVKMLAGSLASIEAIMGQFYIAVLVARLVGLEISQSLLRQEQRSDSGM